jgi:hypothetical protein
VPDQLVFVTGDILAERREHLRQLGVSDRQMRHNRLLADMPEDAWKVLLNELLRERRAKAERKG